jgi:hypothetical protein
MSGAAGGGQLALPLAWPGGSDFLVSACNKAAVRQLEHPALWPVMACVLAGPPRSGRSLLGRIFAARSGGSLLDDADRSDEEAVFHAWNRAQETRRPLLMVASTHPHGWAPRLRDLASRLAASPTAIINAPDERLAEALLERGFAARGLALTPDVNRWLLRRIERSYVAIEATVDLIDRAMLAQKRALTLPLVRAVLAPVIDASHTSA